MYEEFFQLKCRPFDLAPDPKFLYMTEQHARAEANVRFALADHDSFVVISGEIGTGKTTVLNTVLKELGSQFVTARIVHTTLSDIELLQALLSEFGIPNYGTKKVKLLDAIRKFFLEQHLAGRHVVIIVDEAQHLNPASLEELRLLTCIDSQDRRIVSIVLTGQPSLDTVLDDSSLAQLRQRMRLRQRLRPLDQTETVEYIRHRLQIAGGEADEIFAPETLPEIHRLAQGIPRLINTLCDTVLIACAVASERRVDLPRIEYVVKELGWRWPDLGGHRKRDAGDVEVVPNLAGEQALLMVHLPGKVVARVDINAVPFSIGRGQGNRLVIQGREISRRHALIDRVGGRYLVEDLNSSNGVLINGVPRNKAVLVSGDVITIGLIVMEFHIQDDAAEDTGEHTPHNAHDLDNIVAFMETQVLPDEAVPAKDSGALLSRE